MIQKINFQDKQTFQFINLPERQKLTSGNVNEIKEKFNDVIDYLNQLQVPFTGHGYFVDTQHSVESPQIIPQDGFIVLDNNAGQVVNTWSNELELFSEGRIRPSKVGDSFDITISLMASSSSPNGSFEFGIDVGGAIGVIFRDTRRTSQTQNVYNPYSITLTGYMAETFLANGGQVVVRSNTGTLSVYNTAFFIRLITT